MGWPPCGRTMVHWWSKSERGTIVSIWNCAHNIGGMVPGLMVLLASAIYFSEFGVQVKDIWQQALYYLYCRHDLCNSGLFCDERYTTVLRITCN